MLELPTVMVMFAAQRTRALCVEVVDALVKKGGQRIVVRAV